MGVGGGGGGGGWGWGGGGVEHAIIDKKIKMIIKK